MATITKTIGGETGRDYATIALFNAAWGVDADLPTTQVNDIVAEIYGANADGSAGTYSGRISMPKVTGGNYSLTYRGMLGSLWDGGQVYVQSTSTLGLVDNNSGYSTNKLVVFENIKGQSYGALFYTANVTCFYHIKNCRLTSTASSGGGGLIITDSYLHTYTNTLGNGVAHNSILVSDTTYPVSASSSSGIVQLDKCTCRGPYIAQFNTAAVSYFSATNCIFEYTTEFSNSPSTASFTGTGTEHKFFMRFPNCNFRRTTDNTFIAGLTLAEWSVGFENLYSQAGITNNDPQLPNTSGTWTELTDFIPLAASLVRRLNRSIIAGNLNPDDELLFPTQGALGEWAETPLAVGLVKSGTVYAGSTLTGTRTDCPVASAVSGVQYGAGGTELTGTLVQDYPAIGNVYNDTTNGVAGTLTLPTAGQIKAGIVCGAGGNSLTGNRTDCPVDKALTTATYGESGTEFTGTVVIADLPDPITITVTDKADGTGVTYSVVDSEAGSTNYIYYFADAVDADSTLGGSRSGDGTGSISITTAGTYYFYGRTQTSFGHNVSSNLVRADVTDVGDATTTISPQSAIISKYGTTYTIESRTETKTADGHAESTWATKSTITGWLQATSSDIRRKYAMRNITVTHKMFTTTNPTTAMGDRINASGVYYVVRGVINQAGRGVLWRLDLEEEL